MASISLSGMMFNWERLVRGTVEHATTNALSNKKAIEILIIFFMAVYLVG
jgi:hypothetical protein